MTSRDFGSQKWLLKMIADSEFGLIREYLESIKHAFQMLSDSFEKRAIEEISGLSDSEEFEMHGFLNDEAVQLYRYFPKLVWEGTFLTIYATFEKLMMTTTTHLGNAMKTDLTAADLSGKGIRVVQKYFKKVCSIAFPENAREWANTLLLSEIRNSFAHDRGQTKNENILSWVDSEKATTSPKISIVANNQLELSYEFCFDAIENLHKMFNLVIDSIPDTFPKSRPASVSDAADDLLDLPSRLTDK